MGDTGCFFRENDVPTQVLLKLAEYYGTSVDYLLGRTENPEINR